VSLTVHRIEEIEKACRDNSGGGPWVDQLDKIMTEDEQDEVRTHWFLLDGESCFVSAMYDLKLKLMRSQTT
jgi:hypothetical protein